MISTAKREQMFERDLKYFENYRMSPPNHERSSTMVKLKHAHVLSLNTARLFLHRAFDRTHEPRFRKAVEDDIARLDELKTILMYAIGNPELPFDTSKEPDGPKDGRQTD